MYKYTEIKNTQKYSREGELHWDMQLRATIAAALRRHAGRQIPQQIQRMLARAM
jgi:hypothetical protein